MRAGGPIRRPPLANAACSIVKDAGPSAFEPSRPNPIVQVARPGPAARAARRLRHVPGTAADVADFGGAQNWTSDNLTLRELANLNGDGFLDIVGFGSAGVVAGYNHLGLTI